MNEHFFRAENPSRVTAQVEWENDLLQGATVVAVMARRFDSISDYGSADIPQIVFKLRQPTIIDGEPAKYVTFEMFSDPEGNGPGSLQYAGASEAKPDMHHAKAKA